MDDCLFCNLFQGKIPTTILYRDDDCFVINDINPVSKVHILGVPKVKCVDFSDFVLGYDKDIVANFFQKVDVVIEKLGIKDSGYRIISNSGVDGGQEVPHFHIHILGGEKIVAKIR